MNFTDYLTLLLKERKEIPFAEFMNLALYHPQYGYYMGSLPKLGQRGDFITAPELSPLFGQVIANQCQPILQQFSQPIILEFGAGSGQLCVQILKRLEYLQALPQAYWILELSGSLKEVQKKLIAQQLPHLSHKVHWLERWPSAPINGVLIANEVLDAMPVHRFCKEEQGLKESFITLNQQGQLLEIFKPCQEGRLFDYVSRVLPEVPLPYISEANLLMEAWLAQCAKILSAGLFLIMDYGFPRHEYYHPQRRQGTLMCHYHHQAHSNPFLHLGEQDITAHVDFTQAAEAALNAQWQVSGYTNQASFLLANGLLDFISGIENEKMRFIESQASKKLLDPGEMGEMFKVLALTKEVDSALQGFSLFDKRASL